MPRFRYLTLPATVQSEHPARNVSAIRHNRAMHAAESTQRSASAWAESVLTSDQSHRLAKWAGTMAGFPTIQSASSSVVRAHGASDLRLGRGGPTAGRRRQEREEWEDRQLSPGATRAVGAGSRQFDEEADGWRTCFERDRDRIVHSSAFRRLAGKTQVFVFPRDHQRTRLTHALEVNQVAVAISRSLGLNAPLTEAIALGHDCGHGPGGHASEDAFAQFLPEGFDHAVFGAEVMLAPLNLCRETLDGIANHSWSRPAPATLEGEVVSWADRIAYCCHDLEDAVDAGVVPPRKMPAVVKATLGPDRSGQLNYFISAVIDCALETGVVGMRPEPAAALAELRQFNYDHIYTRPASLAQNRSVEALLVSLVEYYIERPDRLPEGSRNPADRARAAVSYVAGMTDRFACATAVSELGFDVERLPRGIDLIA